MSSGEKAKPATFEERNPFDISRRSGNDVAAEIAQRLVAWKQARARSTGARAPTPEPKASAAEKAPTIAAPVQPPRMPKRAPAHETTGDNARAPYFASFSLAKRPAEPAPVSDATTPGTAPGAEAAVFESDRAPG